MSQKDNNNSGKKLKLETSIRDAENKARELRGKGNRMGAEVYENLAKQKRAELSKLEDDEYSRQYTDRIISNDSKKSGNSHSDEFKDYTDQELSQLIHNLSNPTKEISRDDERLNRAKIEFSNRVQPMKGTVSTDDKYKVGVESNKEKLPPTDSTIRLHINQYSVADDPFEVATEIGQRYGWSEKQVERAESIIRKKYIR